MNEGMCVLKVKVISLPYIFQVLYVLCFTRPRYQVSVYRTIGPLVLLDPLKPHFCCIGTGLKGSISHGEFSPKPGFEVIKRFTCTILLSIKFKMLISINLANSLEFI